MVVTVSAVRTMCAANSLWHACSLQCSSMGVGLEVADVELGLDEPVAGAHGPREQVRAVLQVLVGALRHLDAAARDAKLGDACRPRRALLALQRVLSPGRDVAEADGAVAQL